MVMDRYIEGPRLLAATALNSPTRPPIESPFASISLDGGVRSQDGKVGYSSSSGRQWPQETSVVSGVVFGLGFSKHCICKLLYYNDYCTVTVPAGESRLTIRRSRDVLTNIIAHAQQATANQRARNSVSIQLL